MILRGNFDGLPELQIQIWKHQWIAYDLQIKIDYLNMQNGLRTAEKIDFFQRQFF